MVKINVEPNNTLNQNNPGEIEDITPLSGSNAKANKSKISETNGNVLNAIDLLRI